MNKKEAIKNINEHLLHMSAADAADLFLSPNIDSELLCELTAEPGPAMWIVNRSDVLDATLRFFLNHSQAEIARRAEEKLKNRHASLNTLSPPILDEPIEETPDWAVEDVLGHPLVPIEAIFHFSRVTTEDHRASSALSITRRLLEHPVNWDKDLEKKAKLIDIFAHMLLSDSSDYVRSYAARVPILPAEVLHEAAQKERQPHVLGKIIQAQNFSEHSVNSLADRWLGLEKPQDVRVQAILALDKRWNLDLRRKWIEQDRMDQVSRWMHIVSS